MYVIYNLDYRSLMNHEINIFKNDASEVYAWAKHIKKNLFIF